MKSTPIMDKRIPMSLRIGVAFLGLGFNNNLPTIISVILNGKINMNSKIVNAEPIPPFPLHRPQIFIQPIDHPY